MELEKANKIKSIYNVVRVIILVIVFVVIGLSTAKAITPSPLGEGWGEAPNETSLDSLARRIASLEAKLEDMQANQNSLPLWEGRGGSPNLHGILRGKYEYEPDLDASRFEIRNARMSVSGNLPLRSEYKLEVDLCDETEIKMKDAWVRVNPWKSLRISLGQQRMPFSIDAHRNPSAQYFANRSFIAKQVGDMRDVGGMIGYTAPLRLPRGGEKVPTLIFDAGIFNGASISTQKTAWHTDLNYSARMQLIFPLGGQKGGSLVVMPSIQHDAIADRQAHYTSLDLGAYYEMSGWHVEGEYLHKSYSDNAFDDCSSVDAMLIYKHKVGNEKSFFESISYLGRYDWMGDHSSGKSGFEKDANGNATTRLAITDYERHRATVGVTFSVRNKYFPTDLRLNYEKYWYPNGGAKESEQDKLVAEIAIKF